MFRGLREGGFEERARREEVSRCQQRCERRSSKIVLEGQNQFIEIVLKSESGGLSGAIIDSHGRSTINSRQCPRGGGRGRGQLRGAGMTAQTTRTK